MVSENVKHYFRPSYLALYFLGFVVIAMVIVAISSPNDNSGFFGVMDNLVKIIAGAWAGATFGEKYAQRGESNNA